MKKSTIIALTILGSLLGLASLVIFLPYNPNNIDFVVIANPPSFHHIFGTDDLGRDILLRCLYGLRISLLVGFLAMFISLTLGILIGGLAGYFRGILDTVLMRGVDILLSLPTLFVLLTLQAMMRPSLMTVMIVIGATSWMGTSRIVRAEFLKLSQKTFVTALKAYGQKDSIIIFKHILPNAIAPIGVMAVLGIAGTILVESTLSYFGLGVQPPMASLGSMLSTAQDNLATAPWMAIFPGLMIIIIVVCLYIIGENTRERYLRD